MNLQKNGTGEINSEDKLLKGDHNYSIKATAHLAGAVYFVFMIVSIYGEFFLPKYFVPGDATATAHNINTAEFAYRFGILTAFLTHIIFIVLVVILYKLFREVNRSYAMLMVLFVAIGVAVAFANLLNKFAPLVILSGADYLSVFNKAQLDALAFGFLRLHSNAAIIPLVFWGLWLFPFGILVIKSGFLPRILGILLMLAGLGYFTNSIASIILPEYGHMVTKIVMPLYFGEVPIIFWLLIKGAKQQKS